MEAEALKEGDNDGLSEAEGDKLGLSLGLAEAEAEALGLKLALGDNEALPEADGLVLAEGDKLGLGLTLALPPGPRRNTNVPTSDSIPASTFVTSGVPVDVPAVGNVWLATDSTPLPPTFLARSAQLPPGMVTSLSVLIAQQASANAPLVAVVTAGQFGLVSFANAAHAPVPLNATSCGVSGSTPDNAPIHQPTCSPVPAEVNV